MCISSSFIQFCFSAIKIVKIYNKTYIERTPSIIKLLFKHLPSSNFYIFIELVGDEIKEIQISIMKKIANILFMRKFTVTRYIFSGIIQDDMLQYS